MIRVLIVDDICPMGETFSTILAEQSDIEVIGNCTTISQAQQVIANADVILASTTLPGDGAHQLSMGSCKGEFFARVLLIGGSESSEEILRYFEVGAHGFFRREDPVEDLFIHIRSIYRGEAILAPELGSKIIARLAELSRRWEYFLPLPGKLACLTSREREVFYLIARDFTNQEIADYLIIEVGTVKNHVHSILSKLNVSGRREAARLHPQLYAYRKNNSLFAIPLGIPTADPIVRG